MDKNKDLNDFEYISRNIKLVQNRDNLTDKQISSLYEDLEERNFKQFDSTLDLYRIINSTTKRIKDTTEDNNESEERLLTKKKYSNITSTT
ncbi:protein of unknown function [Enterobacter cancerogenus]|uniref:hypothetical protein n=1 Tax=Enterobacter cancerogenus TaxID=69218 RepID=UPI00192615DF|nr:hypothetical protein [Enterobacter cancerogenus]CAD5354072.1 protein of unknown function [Enterobacter cancerogenus]